MLKIQSTGQAQVEEAIKQQLPPCQIKCPINEDIQRTNVQIALLPEDEAAAKPLIMQIGDHLYEKNPFFNICGYICGLCELECNYKNQGGAIKRRLLKRFLSDYFTPSLKDKEELKVPKERENIAVIGGGPGGLMCAYTLSRKGYKVTVFEASDRLGGALWLIPQYRLPEEVLRITVENLVRIASIDVRFNAKVGEGRLTIDRLRNDGYRAIFLAMGTPYPRVLTFDGKVVEGQDLSGVIYGHTLLYEVSHGNISSGYFKGKKLIVIGGGNVAFDVARTARRLGGEVTVVCLENEDKSTPDGIPADETEIRGAWEEGINIIYSHGVQRIVGEEGRFKGINCPKCTSVFDERGFNPKFDCTDCIDLQGDSLIITVGQAYDRAFMQREGLLNEQGRIVVDPFTLQSLRKGYVFIGGDVRRVGFMTEAMKEGLMAADSIERFLRGLDMREGRKKDYEPFGIPRRKFYEPETEVTWIPPEQRLHFHPFEKGLTLKEARVEARRCLACGPCLSCKACISIGFEKSLYAVQVDEEKCSGCGHCVFTCNYDSAHLKEVNGKIISATDMFRCKSCGMCVTACPSQARTLVDDDTAQRIEKAISLL